MEREEFDPDKVIFDDVRNMDEGEFKMWTLLRINDIRKTLSKLDKTLSKLEDRQWFILSGIIITIILTISKFLRNSLMTLRLGREDYSI